MEVLQLIILIGYFKSASADTIRNVHLIASTMAMYHGYFVSQGGRGERLWFGVFFLVTGGVLRALAVLATSEIH